MGKFNHCLGMVLFLFVCVPACSAEPPAKLNVSIVKADSDAWLAGHAAEELSKYVSAMTGATVTVVDDEFEVDEDSDVVFVLSVQAKAPEKKGDDDETFHYEVTTTSFDSPASQLMTMAGAEDPRRLRDGYAIQSTDDGELTIAAIEPIGLLYGVYEYLEQFCGCGFFFDGDYVPTLESLPVDGIDFAELPRWPVRMYSCANNWGLAKYHGYFRTGDQRKQIADWMAKRKVNRSSIDFFPDIAHGGMSAKRVYRIKDNKPNAATFGARGANAFPAEVTTKAIQEELNYARQRNIEYIYYLAFGQVPPDYRQMRPHMKYVGSLGYSATTLYPDDPEAIRLTTAYYKDLIETYGTDHIYQDTPYVESTGSDDLEESFKLKIGAAQQMCEVFKELDPEAVWESDSWDFHAQSRVWTPGRITRYFEETPRDMMLFYDTSGIANPYYKRANYFHGVDWALGVLQYFQGDEHLAGPVKKAVARIQDLSADPKADKCIGIYHIPEHSGSNMLFHQLTVTLSWNPDGMTLGGFLDDYTRRRYGAQDYETMRPAVEALVNAVYGNKSSKKGQFPIYQQMSAGYGPDEWFPLFDDRRGKHPADKGTGIAELQGAIQQALQCRDNQQDNALYENDMVDWTRQYITHLFNAAVIDAYKAFGQGDVGRMNESLAICRESLKHLEAILSTRSDFHIQPQIDRALAVKGANPKLPHIIKFSTISYCVADVYELVHWYLRPYMESYFTELEKRSARGVKTIVFEDIQKGYKKYEERYWQKNATVPAEEAFQGTTIEAIVLAMDFLSPKADKLVSGLQGK